MSNAASNSKVIGSGAGVTTSNRASDRPVARPNDLPGIVIFSHGVNDPGANYETVEEGLCQGLNERLDRPDMVKGEYGARYLQATAAKKKGQANTVQDRIAADPDTYLYSRDGTNAHSVFIPFYWGYRASKKEILKDKSGNPVKLRTQYQDVRGNRLDAHFAKAGGMFNNATTNIPDMYGAGFMSTFVTRRLMQFGMMNNYQFSGQSPERHYQVLAAKRMATLISEIRAVKPDETVTVMAHSQGTVISLLAQAMLHDAGKRCADCLILVDSPYALTEAYLANTASQHGAPLQTVQARLQTLVNIVSQCTKTPHTLPALKDLVFSSPGSGGRAGHKWTSTSGTRPDAHGKPTVFDERDNRGRVYLYWNPNDKTVDIPTVRGIGTYGIPDTVEGTEYFWDGSHTRPQSATNTYAAMNALKELRFYQRVWIKADKNGNQPLVGTKPHQMDVPDIGSRFINGDELKPPFAPKLHGGEAVVGSGKEAPDAVSQDLFLGNSNASLQWIQLPSSGDATADSLKTAFNAGKALDDQTRSVEFRSNGGGFGGAFAGISAWREETPNEARARMSQDPAALTKNDPSGVLQSNSYHSAILRDPWNQRFGTAMDVAVGQAKTMDDKDWLSLWVAIADWKTDIATISSLAMFEKMTPGGQTLVSDACKYYETGTFPESILSSGMPTLVVSQTRGQNENPEKPVTPPFNMDFSGLAR
ncbi:T6SS effector phospholipase Tle3 domain-containing protein [Paraburkholderia tropica]|uniref:T6SS effector phospholipase Tle3 domain-containing protein n=1 Tax=Paraburkholderia tropica TaxID=92647 RepID=UPI002AB040D3|nr:DUF3274 domain-containing protein [Paraburkholderia tropica]